MSKKPSGVYTAAQAVKMSLKTMEEREQAILNGTALSGLFGIKEIDDYFNPLWPGDLLYIAGLPSNGKTFTCRKLSMSIVDVLLRRGDGSKVNVWITTEESVEKTATYWLAGQSKTNSTVLLSGRANESDKHRVKMAVAEVGSWPLYIIGHALSRRDEDGELNKTMRMTTDDIDMCLDYIVNDQGKSIAMITLDYIHRLRNDKGVDREEHIRRAVDWTRDVANWINAPFVVAAQSKSKVADRKYPLPTLADIEWSMNAGQSADNYFGVFMPKMTLGSGGLIEDFAGFKNLIVEPDMMFLGVGKQKDGPSGDIFLLRIKPQYMEWELLEVAEIPLNPEPSRNGGKTHGHHQDEAAVSRNWPSPSQPQFNY